MALLPLVGCRRPARQHDRLAGRADVGPRRPPARSTRRNGRGHCTASPGRSSTAGSRSPRRSGARSCATVTRRGTGSPPSWPRPSPHLHRRAGRRSRRRRPASASASRSNGAATPSAFGLARSPTREVRSLVELTHRRRDGRGQRLAPDGVHPLLDQLRHRGARRRADDRPGARRQGPPRLRGLHVREGAAPRPLPERPAPPDHAAAPAARRHVRGDRLGHRDRRGRRPLP